MLRVLCPVISGTHPAYCGPESTENLWKSITHSVSDVLGVSGYASILFKLPVSDGLGCWGGTGTFSDPFDGFTSVNTRGLTLRSSSY